MLTRTWIDTHLTAKQRDTLIAWLLERAHNPTGEMIRDGLAELFPDLEPPSIQSLLTWRNKVWQFELHRRQLRNDSAAAKTLAEAGADGTHLASANVAILQAMLFEQLRAIREGRMEDVEPETLDTIVKSVTRLAKSSQSERALTAKIRELEAAEEERKAKMKSALQDAKTKDRGGITPETLKRIEEAAGLL